MTDTHYIALIHKDADSAYGVSFADVPGVIAAGDTIDIAIAEASAALAFAFEDWAGPLPKARSLEELRTDPDFTEGAKDAVVAAIRPTRDLIAAE
jgi:predicted RNase H-like HicB family nuclease